jgi:hypothetical protein
LGFAKLNLGGDMNKQTRVKIECQVVI